MESVREKISKLPIPIYVATTWVGFYSDTMGNIGPGINIAPFIRMHLQEREWFYSSEVNGVPIPGTKKLIVTANYSTQDKQTGFVRIPRYTLDLFVSFVGSQNVTLIPVAPNPARHVEIRMKKGFELRDNQIKPFEFLMSGNNYIPLNLGTGVGKTVLFIYFAHKIGLCPIVFLPALVDQWYKSVRDFTRLASKDIFVIKGFNSLRLLWAAMEKGYKPSFILAAMRTVFMYAVDPKGPYAELPPWEELQRALGIGITCSDESHLWFYANVRLQLTCNSQYNVFLSATFARTEWKQDQIFQTIFPVNLRYKQDKISKYTVVNFIQYSLGLPEDVGDKFVSRQFGYNHAKYEKYLLKHRGYLQYFVDSVLLPLIEMYYIRVKKPGQRCLILFRTKAICKHVCTVLNKKYPELKINVYFSGSTSESNLQSDIIVSTHTSCGVGVDIKGLKTCINCVSFGSAPMTQQVMGRLREIPGEDTIYVDMWNKDVGSHQRHYYDRLRIYKQLAKLVFESKIT